MAELKLKVETMAPCVVKKGRKAAPKVAAMQLRAADGFPDLGVPSAFLSPNCVYCISLGYNEETKKNVFKFGLTENFNSRIAAHRSTFPHCAVVFVISLGEYAVKPAEDTIKYFDQVRSRVVEVTVDDANRCECFSCFPEEVDDVMDGIIAEVKRHHGSKIGHVYHKRYKAPDAMQAEAAIKQSEEKTKQLQMVLAFMEKHPERNVDDFMKLL